MSFCYVPCTGPCTSHKVGTQETFYYYLLGILVHKIDYKTHAFSSLTCCPFVWNALPTFLYSAHPVRHDLAITSSAKPS